MIDLIQGNSSHLPLADWGNRGAEAGGGLEGLPMFSKEEA